MKKLIIYFIVVFICVLNLNAQENLTDKNKKSEIKVVKIDSLNGKKVKPDTCRQFRGPNPNPGQCRDGCKDKFIDKDGDGINDNRGKGFGFGRRKKMGNLRDTTQVK